jgi:hypothetical protein
MRLPALPALGGFAIHCGQSGAGTFVTAGDHSHTVVEIRAVPQYWITYDGMTGRHCPCRDLSHPAPTNTPMRTHTMRQRSAEEIRASFVNCTKGQARSANMPTRFDRIDWATLEFLGWRDPKAPDRGYVVLERDDRMTGITLTANTTARSALKKNICAFCTTTHDLTGITLFAARRAGSAGRQGNTVGTYACADLRCADYVSGVISSSVPQPFETLTLAEKNTRTITNLGKFVDRVLG